MQSIASNQNNLSNDEKAMKILSFVLILPQKWKSVIESSHNPFEAIPNNLLVKYSQILKQLFISPLDSTNFFSLFDSNFNFRKDLINADLNSSNLMNINHGREFIQNLLYLSIFRPIYDFLMELTTCKTSYSISFLEKIKFAEILLDYLFQKEHYSNKVLFNQTIRLINCLQSNFHINSPLISTLFERYDISKYKMPNYFNENQLNQNFYDLKNNYEYDSNILRILDLSLSNDSHIGIDLVLSVHSRVSKSSCYSLLSINKHQTIEKLYRFLGQKITSKQFDKSAVSTILLLTSIMNDVFCHKNCFFNLLQDSTKMANDETKIEDTTANFQNKKEYNIVKNDDIDLFSQALNELESLYQFGEKSNIENVLKNGNDCSHISSCPVSSSQSNNNVISAHSDINNMILSNITAPIYADSDLNIPVKPRQSNLSSLSPQKSKINSRYCPMMNKQNKDTHKGFCKLKPVDPNCLSLGAIQEGKTIAPLFPTLYKTYQQFEINDGSLWSSDKTRSKFEGDGNRNNEKEDSSRINEDESLKNDQNNLKGGNSRINEDESQKSDQDNLKEDSSRIREDETPKNDQNNLKEDSSPINEDETPKDDIKPIDVKQIFSSSLFGKDIQELSNSTSTSSNIDLNETRPRKRQPLIPAIPTKPSQPKKPGKIRTLSSLNNIYGTNSTVHSYEQVEKESNTGYSSNYYKASISPSRSFGNVLRTSSKQSNFTVTTGLGPPVRNSLKGDKFGNMKRNSYGFISPISLSTQSDINSSSDTFGSTPQLIHASRSASQYDEDIFPTTFIESVIPEYAKEVNFSNNNSKSTAAAPQSEVANNKLDEEQKEENEDSSQQGNQKVEADESSNENELIESNSSNKSVPQNADSKEKSHDFDSFDDSSDFIDDMDVAATPRGSVRKNMKKRPNSSDFCKIKNSRKVRTSLPPVNIKFNIQKNDEEISLIDLATSSEALNLDDFNIELNRRIISPFSMNRNGLPHSTSGPISRAVPPGYASPLRSSSQYSSADNAQHDERGNHPNGYKTEKDDANSLGFSQNGIIEEVIDDDDDCDSSLLALPPIKEELVDLINEDAEQSKDKQSSDEKENLISEETDVNQNNFPRLEAISEETDVNQNNFPQLEAISEETDQNQQHPFPGLETISEETGRNEYNLPQLETITEEQDENQNNFSPLEAISEETEEIQQQQVQQLDTISEETDENQNNLPQLETISEETDENQNNLPQLETISEETEENQNNLPQLETISEETEENQNNLPQLETISEETEENQNNLPQLETISEETEENQNNLPQLETISEETEENQNYQPQLETISEETEEIQQMQVSPLETISEETEENQNNLPQLETISEETEEIQQQQVSPLETISEETEENQNNLPQLETISEETENYQRHQFPQLESITEEADENHNNLAQLASSSKESQQQQRPFSLEADNSQKPWSSPLESILEETDESKSQHFSLEAISEEPDQMQSQQLQKPFPQLDSISEEPGEMQKQRCYSSPLEAIAEEPQLNSSQLQPKFAPPLTSDLQVPDAQKSHQTESKLFVSIGVLLANELFIKESTLFFQNSVCIYLTSLDKCAGLFDKVMSESNLVMQIINSEKEEIKNQLDKVDPAGPETAANKKVDDDDDDDDDDSMFSFDYHENMKSDLGKISMISKIINNNHDSIPLEFKSQWNEYMKSVLKKEEEDQLQTNDQHISICSHLD